jgi:hypothetical protein
MAVVKQSNYDDDDDDHSSLSGAKVESPNTLMVSCLTVSNENITFPTSFTQNNRN